MELISIIVPAYNSEKTLPGCLNACLEQTYRDLEIIVVDDGSTDGTGRIAQSFPVRYVRQENRGPAAARNRGANEARGTILAFTDADCVPAADWIERLLAGFRDGIVAVGGTYGIANAESTQARMVHEEIRIRHDGFGENVDFVGSFNMAVRAGNFRETGGFDESFTTASAEDNDLAYRLQDAGGRLGFQREAIVAHHHPTRLWPYLRTQARHGYWRMKLYAKHPGRAKRADQYASHWDLLAPPVALGTVVGAVCLGLFCWWPVMVWLSLATLAGGLLYLLGLHLRMAARMRGRTGDRRMWLFCPLGGLRDIARSLGMVAGIIRFWFVERGRA